MKEEKIHNIFLKLEKEKKIEPGPYWVHVLRGDISHRIYYRVYSEKKSYVLCYDQRSIDLKEEDHLFIHTQKLLAQNEIPCPQIIDFDLSEGWLIQEDLGQFDLLQTSAQKNFNEYESYKECLDLVAKLHFVDRSEAENFVKLGFDSEKLMQEIDMTLKYFFTKYLDHDDEGRIDRIRKGFLCIVTKVTDKPRYPVHRDYHSRNIMIDKKQAKMIDFQDMRWGIVQYDLVSLLHDCYYKLSEKNRANLLDYYWDKYSVNIAGFDGKEDFLYYYDLMAIQRIFKAIGSFCYIYIDFKRMNYLQHIGTAMENLRCLLGKYPEFEELKEDIFSVYYAS